jgi:lipoprotein-anchoring transpeptidase ErfK/SrfK
VADNQVVRRVGGVFLCLLTLVVSIGVVAAVSITPRSVNALPAFEFASPRGPVRFSAAELGVGHRDSGFVIDDVKLRHALAVLERHLRRAPKPASYALTPDHRVVLEPGAAGIEIDRNATRRMLLRALRGSRSNLHLPIRAVRAPPPPAHAIVVNLQRFRLDLYRGPKLEQDFTVGVGQLSFPTPPGAYYIRSKAKNPAWRNPHSRWSRGMPAYIPPGPRNPLGTRAMRLDRGALVIHGTPEPWSVGHRSSHGCIRMRRPDVERLYDIVPPHTPVFIVP